MANRLWASLSLVACAFALSSVPAHAQEYSTKLSGFQEVGGLNAETGSIFSPGSATLKMSLDRSARTLTYTLSYDFPPNTNVTQAHIHFGKQHVPGNIMVYFCVGTGTAPPPAPAAVPPTCPAFSGSVTGTLSAQDVTGKAAAQSVNAGDFEALLATLNSDTAYANIHTTAFPAGEIRGQIHRVRPRPFKGDDRDGRGDRDGDDRGHGERGH